MLTKAVYTDIMQNRKIAVRTFLLEWWWRVENDYYYYYLREYQKLTDPISM